MTVNIHDDYEPETNRVRAARQALNAYKVIKTVRADEPERDYEGMPVEAQAWLDWHEHDYQPAARSLSEALDNLEMALGDEFPGRHPFNFVPLCERITTEDRWPLVSVAAEDREYYDNLSDEFSGVLECGCWSSQSDHTCTPDNA